MSEIAKTSYTHDAMIDLIIAHPSITQNAIAAHFGYTPGWVSQVFSSDAFKVRLAERKKELVDPALMATLEEEIESVARVSAKVLRDKLLMNQNADIAERALATSTRALGYGAKDRNSITQNNYLVMMPPKAESSDDWAKQHQPKVIEHDSSS